MIDKVAFETNITSISILCLNCTKSYVVNLWYKYKTTKVIKRKCRK